MKKIKALYLGMAIAAAAGFSACQADMDAPELVAPVATMEANTTILELKTNFANQSVKCPMKDEATQTPYIIHGRVVSSDASGNIYKSIVLQDETAAIALSVNQGSTYVNYPIGQEVVLNVTGLYIGYYNGLQQIGWLGEPYNGETQLGFMAWDLFKSHSEKNGFPDPNVKYVDINGTWPSESPYCIVTSFSQLPTSGNELLKMQSQLVEFRNVHFKEGGVETYAPYQESVNRTLVDANGAELTVRTSGYSNFYNELMPEGNGTVRGILSYYSDAYQLLLRGLGDVLITDKGQKNEPYTVAESMELMNQGAFGWVKGYIVGSVKAGVNDVTSDDDVIFGKDAEMDNNILVAANPDCKNWSECVAVELPQGSAFRSSVNLVDNPGVLGQAILVSGNLTTFLGMPGITGNGGTAADVEVDGVTISGGTTPEDPATGLPNGDGTQDKPYSAAQINAMATTTGTNLYTDVWATGYIVGYVDTGIKSYATDESAKFTAPATVATNLLLANNPDEKDWNKCISVNLPSGSAARTQLNLKDNAGNLGKLLVIKGTITRYVGISGVKEPTEFSLDGTGGGGDTPTPGTGDGTKTNPYNVSQIMSSTTDNAETWVEGYVVGYAPTSYWTDAVFDNTPNAGSTNYTNGTNLILSDQPAGSASADNSIPVGLNASVRSDLAISKNPAIYGAKVKLKGEMTKYFGVRGIKNVTEFEIVSGGGNTPTPEDPVVGAQGDGTEANPFNIAYVQGSTLDSTEAWVVGYVAGYAPTAYWSDAVFGSTPTEGSTNYTNATNCILSDVPPTGSNADNSVPCGLKNTGDVRTTLGISKNPAIYGKKVMVKGEITKYFGIRGIKNVSAYKILD